MEIVMKKNMFLASTLLFSSVVLYGGVAVEAVDYSPTKGNVTFTVDTDPTKPVDPENPGEIIDPEGEHPEGTLGPLSIDFASNFNFGTQKITTTNQTYYAALQEGTYDKDGSDLTTGNFVQVTDKTGELKGWDLSVKQNAQFASDSDELAGAAVTLKNGVLNSITDMQYAPGTHNAGTSLALTPGTEHSLVSAEANQGMGTWTYEFGTVDDGTASESVTLFVPGSSVKKQSGYETTFTWTLVQKP